MITTSSTAFHVKSFASHMFLLAVSRFWFHGVSAGRSEGRITCAPAHNPDFPFPHASDLVFLEGCLSRWTNNAVHDSIPEVLPFHEQRSGKYKGGLIAYSLIEWGDN